MHLVIREHGLEKKAFGETEIFLSLKAAIARLSSCMHTSGEPLAVQHADML